MMDEATEQQTPPIYWHQVPTIFADVALGTATAGGFHRIVLGEIVFNIEDGAKVPAYRPVANLVMHPVAIRALITELQRLEGVVDEQA